MTDERNAEIIISRVKKAVSYLLTLIIAASACLVVYATIQSKKGKAASVFGRYVLQIVTGSMDPTLKEGDFIIVRKTDPDEIEAGDIISFYSEEDDVRGKIVTHRVEKINPDGSFTTRGDANPASDKKPVRKDQVLGRYVRKARYMRWMSSFTDKKKLLLLLVIIPTTAMALYEVRTITKLGRAAAEETSEEERERLIREAIDKEKERLARENYSPDDDEAPPEEEASGNETGAEDLPEESAEEMTDKEAETIESGKDNEEEDDRSDNTVSDNADSSDNLHSSVRRRDEESSEDV